MGNEFVYSVIIIVLIGFVFLISIIISDQIKIKTLKKKIKQKPASIELREFLADLAAGEALISIQRVNPDHLFTYSPKDK